VGVLVKLPGPVKSGIIGVVTEERNFTRTATKLGLSQTTNAVRSAISSRRIDHHGFGFMHF